MIAVTFAVCLLVGAGGAPDAAKKDMEWLEGEWSMVSGEADGQPLPKEFLKKGAP